MFSCGIWLSPTAFPGLFSSCPVGESRRHIHLYLCTSLLCFLGYPCKHHPLTWDIWAFPWTWPLLCPVTSCPTALSNFMFRFSLLPSTSCKPLSSCVSTVFSHVSTMSSHVSTVFSHVSTVSSHVNTLFTCFCLHMSMLSLHTWTLCFHMSALCLHMWELCLHMSVLCLHKWVLCFNMWALCFTCEHCVFSMFVPLRICPLPEVPPGMTQRRCSCQVGIEPSVLLREILRSLFWYNP